MIIRAVVTRSDLKTSAQILLKSCLQFLATSTSVTNDAITLKFFPDTSYSLLKS